MLKNRKIFDETNSYTILEVGDIEFVNPIEYFIKITFEANYFMLKEVISKSKHSISEELIERFIDKESYRYALEKYVEINQLEIPKALIDLIEAKSKKAQILSLRNFSITKKELIAFGFYTSKLRNFKFSQYKSEHHHNGLDIQDLPEIFEIKDENITKVGKSPLTDGQLKQALNHRKIIISKFFGDETSWHCFFLTFDSLNGIEKWKGGKPHYHYISDKFGIPRQSVINQLKSKKYNLGNLPHIELIPDKESFHD